MASPRHAFPVVRTKLEPPQQRGAMVERGRVLTRLRVGERQTLNVLVAPAGSGKSTLLAQWRRALVAGGRTVCWLSLDESDSRESLFLASLVAALAHGGCAVGRDALVDYEQQRRADAGERFIAELVNELCAVRGHAHLFLDDFHLVGAERVPALVRRLVQYAPPHLHLVVASRALPDLGLAQLGLGERATVHEARELRFDFEETRAFLEERLTVKVGPGELRTLYDVTEGWVGGLQLAALALNRVQNVPDYVRGFARGSRDIGEYLAAEVLARLPDEVVAFLVRTAVLSRFNADLCEYVSGIHGCERLLRRIEAENLFVIPLDREGRWYRYHHLFQALLRERAARLPDAEQADAHRRASQWFRERGLLVDAVEHAMQSGDIACALDTLERCAMDLVERGNLATLADWLERLPAVEVAGRWPLQLARLWALILGVRIDEARALLRDLLADLVPGDRGRGFVTAVAAGGIAAYGDDDAGARELLAWFPPQGDRYHVGAACNIVSFGHLYAGQLDEARNVQTWAKRWDEADRSRFTVVYSRCLTAHSYQLEGQLDAALELLTPALAGAEAESGERAAPACVAASFLADVRYERDDLDGVLDAVAHRMQLIRELVLPMGIILATTAYARARALRGQRWDAEDALQRLRAQGEQRQCPRMTVAGLAGRIRLLLADGAAGEAAAQQALLERYAATHLDGRPASGTFAEARRLVRLSRAAVALAAGHGARAADLAGAVRAEYERLGWHVPALRAGLLQAAAHLQAGQPAHATALAAPALAQARSFGLLRSLLDIGPALEPVLAQARTQADDESRTWLDALLARGAQRPGSAAAPAPVPPASFDLSVREGEILALLNGGLPTKVIASTLLVSGETVKWHLKNLYRKFGVANRYHAVLRARELGLVPDRAATQHERPPRP